MSIKATVLFGMPQQEIATLLRQKLTSSNSTSIVTGFATPGGLEAIAAPIKARPGSVSAIILGAATYPGFEALDELAAAGVPSSRLHVHLGHTRPSGSRKKPTVRFHPMLHSKIYFMDLPGGQACAFIGSHNMTSFALKGLNGEASVLIEGPSTDPEFQRVRDHIDQAKSQSTAYTPDMKESLAWWTREFVDGMKSEVKLPIEWSIVRTILVFAQAGKSDRPKIGDEFFFEIPAGIEQVDSLKTETHLFLFETLPGDPWDALHRTMTADAHYTCKTLGAENKQGNREVNADWRIEGNSPPILRSVPTKLFRPSTAPGMQQVRAEVESRGVVPYEYLFDRQKKEWDPVYDGRDATIFASASNRLGRGMQEPDPDDPHPDRGWELVTGLVPRDKVPEERDAAALLLATPESGRMILVSLRRRKKDSKQDEGDEK